MKIFYPSMIESNKDHPNHGKPVYVEVSAKQWCVYHSTKVKKKVKAKLRRVFKYMYNQCR